ncbi:MAG: 16S rRNA (cytidine(1402)-2'-O)-methyltransferase [Thermoleophilia bacterium]|jgi:16S rRNA (cytidine1402-2'-O)-methyltransferase
MLYICPTPIGNLADVTLRVLDVLRRVDLVACEDTRRTRVLLDRHGITARTISFHGHNEELRVALLLPRLRAGEEIALVSDAGMPGLSDPGFSLVRACVSENLPVTVLPGPSAVSTALVVSGLPVDDFAFIGFLERGAAKLVEQLARFEATGAAVVAFESPRRVRASLAAIGERWPDRLLALCRELTKIHEEVVRGTAAEILDRLMDPVRGEIVLVLAPSGVVPQRGRGCASGSGYPGVPLAVDAVEHRARVALADLVQLGIGMKKAARIVAGLTGLPARRAYELGLEGRHEQVDDGEDPV